MFKKSTFRSIVFSLCSLVCLWSMICLYAWAGELEVYINNKPFSGKVIKLSGSYYAETEALSKSLKTLKYNEQEKQYYFQDKALQNIKKVQNQGKDTLYLSLKELAELSGGRYEFNGTTNILDVYTFNSQKIAENISREVFSSSDINDEDKLEFLIGRIKEILINDLGMNLGDFPIEILFVDKSELMSTTHHNDALGYTEQLVQDHKVIELKVYIQKGLTLGKAVHTAAHEITHAWAGLNKCVSSDIIEEEGFAEWVAYKVLLSLGFKDEAGDMQLNPDPLYGGGLRRVLDREKQFGTAWVMKYKKGNKNTMF
jgi:hypothetical protein